MRYNVGDKVVLKEIPDDDVEIIGVDEADASYIASFTEFHGKLMTIYPYDIDHEKTATLNGENYAKYMEEQINDPAYQELLKELSEPVVDTVNHPPHYTQGKIEVIDIIEVLTEGYTGYQGYLVGNVVKYIARANFKGNKQEDLEKAEFYYKRLLEDVEGDNET